MVEKLGCVWGMIYIVGSAPNLKKNFNPHIEPYGP